MNTAYEAMLFARGAHKTQRSRYSNNLYADHLAEVAGIVATTVESDPSGSELAAVLPVPEAFKHVAEHSKAGHTIFVDSNPARPREPMTEMAVFYRVASAPRAGAGVTE
jgi:hypothetical protein